VVIVTGPDGRFAVKVFGARIAVISRAIRTARRHGHSLGFANRRYTDSEKTIIASGTHLGWRCYSWNTLLVKFVGTGLGFALWSIVAVGASLIAKSSGRRDEARVAAIAILNRQRNRIQFDCRYPCQSHHLRSGGLGSGAIEASPYQCQACPPLPYSRLRDCSDLRGPQRQVVARVLSIRHQGLVCHQALD
jgi:hypothetical protein